MPDQNPYLALVQSDASPGEANPYHAVLAETDAATNTAGRLSVMQVADRNPDVEARLQSLAKQYGVPTDAIRLQQPDYERRATVDAIDYVRLAREYPATAAMVGNPQKAAISYDDTPNLSAIEKGVRFLTNSGRALVSGLVPTVNEGLWGLAQSGAESLAAITDPLAGTILPENPFARVARAAWPRCASGRLPCARI